MPAGGLRTQLDVEVNEPRRDDAGQPIENWKKLKNLAFEIIPTAGGEARRGLQVEATTTHVLKCRYFAGANSAMRLKRGTRVFEVERVFDEKEQRRWLVWLAHEVT